MKIFKKIILMSVLSSVVILVSAATFKDIYTALRTGNADALAEHFDDRILLTISGGGFDIQNTYSKAQAKGVIKDFFTESKPKKFEEKHRNDDNDKPLYRIGYLKTGKGIFRTLIRVKEIEGLIKIQEIELSLDKSAEKE